MEPLSFLLGLMRYGWEWELHAELPYGSAPFLGAAALPPVRYVLALRRGDLRIVGKGARIAEAVADAREQVCGALGTLGTAGESE